MTQPTSKFSAEQWSSSQSGAPDRPFNIVPQASQASRLCAVAMPAPTLSARQLLAAAGSNPRFYWAATAAKDDEHETIAAIGVASELTTAVLLGVAQQHALNRFDDIRTQVLELFDDSRLLILNVQHQLEVISRHSRHPARPRLIGGFAFSPEFVPDNTWSVFHPAHFILPHFQLVEIAGGRWLTINAMVSPEEDEGDVVEGLAEALRTFHQVVTKPPETRQQQMRTPVQVNPDGGRIRYPMSKSQWNAMVASGLSAIEHNRLKKVVLSRVGEFRPGKAIEPLTVLAKLEEQYPDCYRFIFEPVPGHAFLGATPELLVSVQNDRLQTMALAGSIRRGQSDAEDGELAARLMATPKERLEHQLVVDEVEARLSRVAVATDRIAYPQVLKLYNIQHLLTPFSGRIVDRSQVDVLTLVELLHPTPALGGTPPDSALQFLVDVEPVPRGWYAAPIGWLDANLDGAFAVAIRSAVCQHGRAWLYAGAGIMADSVAEREWAETELKFKPMLDALMATA